MTEYVNTDDANPVSDRTLIPPRCSGLIAGSRSASFGQPLNILTFLPDVPLVEFNYIFITAGKHRGHHFHPQFDEYFLLVEGRATFVSDTQHFVLTPGQCVLNRAGSAHRVSALSDCAAVALLTRRWEDSDPPIIFREVK